MSYCTPADVRNALAPGDYTQPGPPAQPTHTAADLSDVQLADAINEASQLVDAYLGQRYTTPIEDPAPEPVPAWTRNVAAYLATLTYRRGKDLSPNDPVALRYAQTIAPLTAVRDGKAVLNLPSGEGTSTAMAGAGMPINQFSGRLFDPGDFGLGYEPLNWISPYWIDP